MEYTIPAQKGIWLLKGKVHLKRAWRGEDVLENFELNTSDTIEQVCINNLGSGKSTYMSHAHT